uniref:Rhomboid protein Ginbi_RBL10 n=1 Tax=Ginkgo biloba TaxID=3311 RepID=A0A0A7E6L5_GINBI|nr:rhomboid protein Ginbi_RBL10 [Ginkgo biloba]|eukprot:Gb_03198 [translate_table: standard]
MTTNPPSGNLSWGFINWKWNCGRGFLASKEFITLACGLELGAARLNAKFANFPKSKFILRSTFQDSYCLEHGIGSSEDWKRDCIGLYKELDFADKWPTVFLAGSSSWLSGLFRKERNKGLQNARVEGGSSLQSSSKHPLSGRVCTNILLGLNILVYVAQIVSQGKLTLWGAKVNSLINQGQIWRLVTSSLLHANIGHLLVNCYSLNSVGPTVEKLSGHRRYLAVYTASAVASSTMSYYLCKAPAVGASGAIFGLVGSLVVFLLRHKNLMSNGQQSLSQITRVIALNMVLGLVSQGIDNWGHIGGLIGGASLSWLLGPALSFESTCEGGRRVLVDRPPISYFLDWGRRPL